MILLYIFSSMEFQYKTQTKNMTISMVTISAWLLNMLLWLLFNNFNIQRDLTGNCILYVYFK